MNIKQLTTCYIEKNMFQNDRDCIVKDPTADVLEILSVVDRKLKRAWTTDFIHLKCATINDEIQYMYEIDRIYTSTCPPAELETLIKYAIIHNIDTFYAFLWFCERQAIKYAQDAQDAAYAATAAAYAADAAAYAAAHAATAAAYAADAAAYAATAAGCAADAAAYAADAAAYAAAAADAAEIEQILFLRRCLGGSFV